RKRDLNAEGADENVEGSYRARWTVIMHLHKSQGRESQSRQLGRRGSRNDLRRGAVLDRSAQRIIGIRLRVHQAMRTRIVGLRNRLRILFVANARESIQGIDF